MFPKQLYWNDPRADFKLKCLYISVWKCLCVQCDFVIFECKRRCDYKVALSFQYWHGTTSLHLFLSSHLSLSPPLLLISRRAWKQLFDHYNTFIHALRNDFELWRMLEKAWRYTPHYNKFTMNKCIL